MEEIKEDCKYFMQHYNYNKQSKRLVKIQCGSCTKTRRHKCTGCPHYEPHDISEEIICLSVYRMFWQFTHALKMYEKQLTEELKTHKQKNTDTNR